MRIGIHAAQSGRLADPAAVRAVALAAEQVGYAAIWAGDEGCDRAPGAGHADLRYDLDPFAVLAASAAVTSQVRLGAGVLAATGHQPAVLARALRSLDVMSEGRLAVALRAPADLLLVHLDLLVPPDVPRAQRPPVLVAAATEEEVDLVARRADGWVAEGLAIARFEDLRGHLGERARAHGRGADDLEVVVRADIALADAPLGGDRPVFAGHRDQVVDDLVAVGEAGADEVVLHVLGDLSLDELLGTYAELAEAVGARVPVGR